MARKLPRFLTPAEFKEMLKICGKNRKYRLLVEMMYFLGLRNSEIRDLLIEDIDLINMTVKVVSGKGEKDRYVPIPRIFANDVKAWIGEYREGRLIRGRSRDGNLSDRQIRRIVKDLAQRAYIRKPDEIHPHTLRHSYATHLQNQGVPLNIIQTLLGHSRIETTTIYLHTGIEKAREHIDRAFAEF